MYRCSHAVGVAVKPQSPTGRELRVQPAAAASPRRPSHMPCTECSHAVGVAVKRLALELQDLVTWSSLNRGRQREIQRVEPPAMIHGYHVIMGMYGFWLPNDPRGSWSSSLGHGNCSGSERPQGRIDRTTLLTRRRRTAASGGKEAPQVSTRDTQWPPSVGGRPRISPGQVKMQISRSGLAPSCRNTSTWSLPDTATKWRRSPTCSRARRPSRLRTEDLDPMARNHSRIASGEKSVGSQCLESVPGFRGGDRKCDPLC